MAKKVRHYAKKRPIMSNKEEGPLKLAWRGLLYYAIATLVFVLLWVAIVYWI